MGITRSGVGSSNSNRAASGSQDAACSRCYAAALACALLLLLLLLQACRRLTWFAATLFMGRLGGHSSGTWQSAAVRTAAAMYIQQAYLLFCNCTEPSSSLCMSLRLCVR
jgi:hypothetical protein